MIFFDSHVHIYPDYNLDVLFSEFATNAKCYAPNADTLAMAVMLREFQPSLKSLFNGRSLRMWHVDPGPENSMTASDGDKKIILIPARQVAAKERVEALGFFGEELIPDGLPLKETISRLRAADFAPALAWGLGKWLFKRGKLVKEVIQGTKDTGVLLIADSALRPTFWSEPLYKEAESFGLRTICGSDPLPRVGDEFSAGRYAVLINAKLNPVAPATSLLSAILEPNTEIQPVGRRYGLIDTIKRLK